MGEQNFSFEIDIITTSFNEIKANHPNASAITIKSRIHDKMNLSWNPRNGSLNGDRSIHIPDDIDLDDPLSEEGILTNAMDNLIQEFDDILTAYLRSL